MKLLRLTALIVLCCVAVPVLRAQDKDKDKDKIDAGTKAIVAWLAIVDAGKYEQSWEEASAFFKEKVTKDKWTEDMKETRAPLGKNQSRRLDFADYTTEVEDGPAGECVFILYRSKFEKLADAVETVVVVLEKNGRWRLAGFVIVPVK